MNFLQFDAIRPMTVPAIKESGNATHTAKSKVKKQEGRAVKGKSEAQRTHGAAHNLSDGAKAVLKELQQKYGNMDFFVGDSEAENASEIMSRGTKEYSVMIEPEILEEMANDPAAKEKYMGTIDDSTEKLNSIKEEMTDEEKADIKNMGFSISKDGTVSFFAEMEKAGDAARKRIEETREERRKEAAREKNGDGAKKHIVTDQEDQITDEIREKIKSNFDEMFKVKKTTIHADSADVLLEAIRNVDWESIEGEWKLPRQHDGSLGHRFDINA